MHSHFVSLLAHSLPLVSTLFHLSFLLHLLLILPSSSSLVSPGYFAPCPTEGVLYPCGCHHHERIECTNSLRYHLPSVFASLVSSLAPVHPRPLYHEFFLSNARLTELDNNFLSTTRFEQISLVDMSSLIKIEANAFIGTEENVLYFAIKGKLFNSKLFDLFECCFYIS